MLFKLKDRTGERYGRWIVIKMSHKDNSGHYWWFCKCDCGTERALPANYLSSGESNSCGCYAKESRRQRATTHGLSHTNLYGIWAGIIQRCEDTKSDGYARYGGRGIKMCYKWRTNFTNFYTWALANGYQKGLTIDRYPNKKGNYQPSNCRWATPKQQSRNQTSNRLLKINGITKCVSEWAEDRRISPKTIFTRLARGWKNKEAIYGRD